jgi:hypothetical protein
MSPVHAKACDQAMPHITAQPGQDIIELISIDGILGLQRKEATAMGT